MSTRRSDGQPAPWQWTTDLAEVEALTDRQIAVLASALTTDPAPVEPDVAVALLARYPQLWAAADRLLELTGHALTAQRWPHDLVAAERRLHALLDASDDG